jgi:hopene-associated glycosyltransferase HpnB
MPTLSTLTTTLIAGMSLGIWVYLLFARGWFWRMSTAAPVPPRDGAVPSVTAVVPARNEAGVVGRAMKSLVAQAYGGEFRIVLVDDGSEDGTARVARAAAPDVDVVTAGPLPADWGGKMWAVAQGVAMAHGEYLLLTDADIVHPPDSVAGLVARAREGGYDLVSYMVRLHCGTWAEQALIPAFVFFFFLLYPPEWIAMAGRETAGAAGGCILIRREALERIGGIARIRRELIDDCSLAREVKRKGGRVWLGLGDCIHSVREYGTFGEVGQMISRTAYTQLGYSPLLLAGTVLGLVLTFLTPPVLALAGPRGAASGMGTLAWLIMMAAYWPAVRYYGRPWFWAPLLPLIAVFYLGATVYSAGMYYLGRGGMWKGRTAGRPQTWRARFCRTFYSNEKPDGPVCDEAGPLASRMDMP